MKTGCFLFILQHSVFVQWEQTYPSIALFWVTCPSNLPTRQIYELTITSICKLTKQHGALYIVKFYIAGLLINFPPSSKYRKLFCYTWRYTLFLLPQAPTWLCMVLPATNRWCPVTTVFGQRQPPFNPLHQAFFFPLLSIKGWQAPEFKAELFSLPQLISPRD